MIVPSAACSTASAFWAVRISTPRSRSDAVSWTQANSSSLGISRRAPSISVTWLPSVWNACDISTPTTPPPRIDHPRGISLAIVASRFVQAPSIESSPGSAASRRLSRRRENGAFGLDLLVADADPPLPDELPAAADQLDLAVLEPRQLGVVVEVVDDLVAPREHRGDVELTRHGLGRAGDPLDLRERFVGRSRAFDGMHAQYEHSPPTSRSSTIATFSPFSASRPATTSPAGPAPSTTTSKLRMASTLTATTMEVHNSLGTTGFDVVVSWGRLRAEVPEAS